MGIFFFMKKIQMYNLLIWNDYLKGLFNGWSRNFCIYLWQWSRSLSNLIPVHLSENRNWKLKNFFNETKSMILQPLFLLSTVFLTTWCLSCTSVKVHLEPSRTGFILSLPWTLTNDHMCQWCFFFVTVFRQRSGTRACRVLSKCLHLL